MISASIRLAGISAYDATAANFNGQCGPTRCSPVIRSVCRTALIDVLLGGRRRSP